MNLVSIPTLPNSVLRTIWTMRSVREYKADTVDDDHLRLVLESAIRAASGGNSQPWAFVVIKEREKKLKVQGVVSKAWHQELDAAIRGMRGARRRMYVSAGELVDHTADVPVIVLACLDTGKTGRAHLAGASIYPSVQNLMLAAWSLGLGTCLTTHGCSPARSEDDVKKILSIPQNFRIMACIYLGYPAQALSPPKRRPLESVLHYDGW